jgi:hypothetical protein
MQLMYHSFGQTEDFELKPKGIRGVDVVVELKIFYCL